MAQAKTLISIGMPVYNGEKYIRTALDSLLSQTFESFELIISDNASTDNTERICREYQSNDSRVVYTRQPTNLGAAANFKFVLDQATSEYFMWAAHDDFWKPEFITQALASFSDSSVGFVFPTFKLKSIHLGIYRKIQGRIFKEIEGRSRDRRVLKFANLHHCCHKCNLVYSLFRTPILREALAIQDISNDGLLSMVILGITRGLILENFYFSKRYSMLWPGFRKKLLVRPEKVSRFEKIRDDGFDRAKHLFPELKIELEQIRMNYKAYRYNPGFEIVSGLMKNAPTDTCIIQDIEPESRSRLKNG